MARPLAQVLHDLESLSEADFDEWNPQAGGPERLAALCDELQILNDPAASAPAMFRFMERIGDAELGTPGPLVHTLERWPGRYEPHLAESVRRKPSRLGVWMVNRIVNTNLANRDRWVELLRAAASNPLASNAAKELAADFMRHQSPT